MSRIVDSLKPGQFVLADEVGSMPLDASTLDAARGEALTEMEFGEWPGERTGTINALLIGVTPEGNEVEEDLTVEVEPEFSAEDAINESIAMGAIARVLAFSRSDVERLVTDLLAAGGEDSVLVRGGGESMSHTDVWGTDDDGNAWRVKVMHRF